MFVCCIVFCYNHYIILVHLCDVMGAEVIYQFVKWLLVFRAVDFGELFHCFAKFFVQLGSAGHSVAVSSETPDNKGQTSMKQMYNRIGVIFRTRGVCREISVLIILPVVLTGHALACKAELVILSFFQGVFSQFRIGTS